MSSKKERFCIFIRYSVRTVCWIVLCIFLLSVAIEAQASQRIISLAPSITEILFAMGVGEKVVGVTAFCDRPPEAKEKKKIGGMSNPSVESIVRLKPDVVILTTDGNSEEVNIKLKSLGIKTYVFKARRIGELPDAIKALGVAIEETEKAERLARKIEDAIRGFSENKRSDKKRKTLFIIWPQPLMVAGTDTAINDAFEILGLENQVKAPRYPRYSVEEILRNPPDIIFIGVGMDSDSENIKEFSNVLLGRIKDIDAVRNGRVYYVSDLLYRLGPGVIKGIKELSEYVDR